MTNITDFDQTDPKEQSDLGLQCLLRPLNKYLEVLGYICIFNLTDIKVEFVMKLQSLC